MRDEWYGDKRDLIKWGVLLELERRFDANYILSEWESLKIDHEEVQLNSAVLRHFRNPFSASRIACRSRIEVIRKPFRDRDDYRKVVLKKIREQQGAPGIIFLDPDTGLRSDLFLR